MRFLPSLLFVGVFLEGVGAATPDEDVARVTLAGHSAAATCVAVNPKADQLASGSADQKVRLWDSRSGKLQHTLSGHTVGVRAVAFSPDGMVLASASLDQTVRFWEADTGKPTGTLTMTAAVHSIAFSPDGKYLASGSGENGSGLLNVWEMDRDGKNAVWLFRKETVAPVRAVLFSPDGQLLFTGGANGALVAWKVRLPATPAMPLYECSGLPGPLAGLACSPDGKTLATSDADGVKLWDATIGKEVAAFKTGQVVSVAFRDDDTLASGGLEGLLRLYDVRQRKTTAILRPHGDQRIYGVAFSPDGKTLASASEDRTVKRYDVEAMPLVCNSPVPDEGMVPVAFNHKGDRIACGADKHAFLLDATTGKIVQTLPFPNKVFNLAFHPDDRFVALLSNEGMSMLSLWDLSSGKMKEIGRLPREGHTVRFSPDGKFLAVAGGSRHLNIADLTFWRFEAVTQTFTRLYSIEESGGGHFTGLAFQPDGKSVAVGRYDGMIEIWDCSGPTAPGAPRLKVRATDGSNNSVHFSPDGKKLFSVGSGVVKRWDAFTLKEEAVLTRSYSTSGWNDLSADGKLAAVTCDFTQTACVCDTARGGKLAILSGHTNRVYGAAISPDGKRMATGSSNGTVKVWNLEKMRQRKGPVIWIGEKVAPMGPAPE